jgi:precorrin-6y C5,15-methyltransferase (decarboxylating) CbiE subunit/precorrin-6Y C5,15-methyltransferase (decarboxylating) CbiT subunit
MGPLRPALDALATHDGDAVVLASGDPGFFGIVRALRDRGLDCVVLPAISSVAQAFARAGLPWDDALVVSAHGRELRAAVNVCRAHPKVAVLTGPGQGPAEIGAALAGWPRRLLVAEDLGAPGERLTECSPADAAQREWSDPNVVLSLADPPPAPPIPAPPASAPSSTTSASSPGAAPDPARPAPPPPVTNPSSTPPAPSGGGSEFVINRLVLSQQHQSVDHEGSEPLRGLTSPRSHTRPTSESPAGLRPADPSVIMGLLGSEQQQSHDHEGGLLPSGPRGLGNHKGLSGAGASWCWPLWPGTGGEGWALGEEAFEHRDSMVTKPEVRALALARLGPRPGTLVWDVGSGSGSVAVECARFGAAVIAVERDPAQCARVAANARRHRAEVRVVGGTAPEALDGLPDPDAVFVGGGGLAVVSAVAARRPARIVVALAAVQRAGPAMEALAGAGYTVDGTLLQASRLAPLPDGAHRLAAANPVFLLWAARDHDHGQLGAL